MMFVIDPLTIYHTDLVCGAGWEFSQDACYPKPLGSNPSSVLHVWHFCATPCSSGSLKLGWVSPPNAHSVRALWWTGLPLRLSLCSFCLEQTPVCCEPDQDKCLEDGWMDVHCATALSSLPISIWCFGSFMPLASVVICHWFLLK